MADIRGQPDISRRVAAAAMVVGIIVWVPVELLQRFGLGSRQVLFYAGAYPIMIGACFYLSRRYPKRPWVLAIFMLAANYIAGLLWVPGVGNMLPFEVLIYCVLALLPAWVAKSGAAYWEADRRANVSG